MNKLEYHTVRSTVGYSIFDTYKKHSIMGIEVVGFIKNVQNVADAHK